MKEKMTRVRWMRLSQPEKRAFIARARKVVVRKFEERCPVTGNLVARYKPVLRGMVFLSTTSPKYGWRTPDRARRDGERILAVCRDFSRGGATHG